ncbi:MAG: hypothetical protein ACTSWW_04470 [Promethearchaeota archaeon]
MTIPEKESNPEPELESKTENDVEPVPTLTITEWIEANKMLILGWVFGLINSVLILNYFTLNTYLFLLLLGAPSSLIIYRRYVKAQKDHPNPKAAKYTLLLPCIFWLFAMLIYAISVSSTLHYRDLAIYYSIHLIVSGFLFLYRKLPGGVHQWVEAHRLYFLGGVYVLFHIYLSYVFILNNLNFRAGLSPSPENLSVVGLWFLGIPASLLLGIFSVKSVKAKPKSVRYLLLLPIIFGIVTFALYPDVYFKALWVYFFVQFIGVIYLVALSGDGADKQQRVMSEVV